MVVIFRLRLFTLFTHYKYLQYHSKMPRRKREESSESEENNKKIKYESELSSSSELPSDSDDSYVDDASEEIVSEEKEEEPSNEDSEASKEDDSFIVDDEELNSEDVEFLEENSDLLELLHNTLGDMVNTKKNKWIEELPEAEKEKVKGEYETVLDEIEQEEITKSKMFVNKLPIEVKKKIYKKSLSMGAYAKYSIEWVHFQKQINRIISDYMYLLSTDNKKLLEQKSKKQGKLISRIADWKSTEKNKERALQLYEDDVFADNNNKEESRNKLELALSIPNEPKKIEGTHREILSRMQKALDEQLYGMKEVKTAVIERVNNFLISPSTRTSLALCSPPGYAKTKLCEIVANSLGLPFKRISLGGLEDSTLLKGHQSVWKGSEPGMIIQILKQFQCTNGIILFDEIDKLGATAKGMAVQYALLHITDYTSNNKFEDSYLNGFEFDLSKMWFMFAMNDDTRLDAALKDRIDIIKIEKMKRADFVSMTQNYLFPAIAKEMGVDTTKIGITEGACKTLVDRLRGSVNRTGARPLENALRQILSKINLLITFDGDCNNYVKVPNFKLPFQIESSHLSELYTGKDENAVPPGMYL